VDALAGPVAAIRRLSVFIVSRFALRDTRSPNNLRVTVVGAGLVHRRCATVIVRFRVDVIFRQEAKGCVPAPERVGECSGPWQLGDGCRHPLGAGF